MPRRVRGGTESGRERGGMAASRRGIVARRTHAAASLEEEKKLRPYLWPKLFMYRCIYLFTYLFIAPIGHRQAGFAWVSSLMVRACACVCAALSLAD